MRRNIAADVLAKIYPDPAGTSCALWSGAHDPDGYPLIKWEGKTVRATRLVWILQRGPIPGGQFVLHTCDRPSCINVAHFFLGDAAANQADCAAKGRVSRGAAHAAKLNPARGDKHSSRTRPEKLRRGAQHPYFGKPCTRSRDPETGRFLPDIG